jgi:hypothetical protein
MNNNDNEKEKAKKSTTNEAKQAETYHKRASPAVSSRLFFML